VIEMLAVVGICGSVLVKEAIIWLIYDVLSIMREWSKKTQENTLQDEQTYHITYPIRSSK